MNYPLSKNYVLELYEKEISRKEIKTRWKIAPFIWLLLSESQTATLDV